MTRKGSMIATVVSGSAEDLDRLRSDFEDRHHLLLPGFLEAGLLDDIRRMVHEAAFYERVHEGIGHNKELCISQDSKITHSLNFIMNNYILFNYICSITQSERIGSFTGRVYRFVPGQGHSDAWHDDLIDHRMIAMSINLSSAVYSGGVLQLRDRRNEQILGEVANVGFGDAIVFRLADNLEHRVTIVEGEVPKTAYAGWFLSQPDFLSIFKDDRRQAEKNQ